MIKGRKVKAIVKRINQPAEVISITDELKSYQEIVGGYIECINFPNDKRLTITLNDEGKLNELAPSLLMPEYKDVIAGNLIVTANGKSGRAADLTEQQIEKVMAYVKENEVNHISMQTAAALMFHTADEQEKTKKEKTNMVLTVRDLAKIINGVGAKNDVSEDEEFTEEVSQTEAQPREEIEAE